MIRQWQCRKKGEDCLCWQTVAADTAPDAAEAYCELGDGEQVAEYLQSGCMVEVRADVFAAIRLYHVTAEAVVNYSAFEETE